MAWEAKSRKISFLVFRSASTPPPHLSRNEGLGGVALIDGWQWMEVLQLCVSDTMRVMRNSINSSNQLKVTLLFTTTCRIAYVISHLVPFTYFFLVYRNVFHFSCTYCSRQRLVVPISTIPFRTTMVSSVEGSLAKAICC